MSRGRRHFAAWLLALVLSSAFAAFGGEAPKSFGWRGDGSGLFPKADPPTEWDIDTGKNILWKTEVGKSQSSPIVVGDRVFLTAEQDLLLCVDRKTGKILWQKDNGYTALPTGMKVPEKRPPASPGCGYSTPTPVSDGKAVYASFGTGVVACYDFDGTRRWIQYLDMEQTTEYGRSASPVLAGGKLIVSLGGLDALDPQTGKTLWEAKDAKCSYGSPAVARIGDVDVLFTPMGDCVRVSDGKILAEELGKAKYVTPAVLDGGIVVYASPPAVALKLPAKAADTVKPTRLWENEDIEGEFFASPVCHDGLIYTASNEGVLYVLDAKTGKIAWQKELDIPSAGGKMGAEPANLYPSLALVGKHILLGNDTGTTLVLVPGREYKALSRNVLDKGCGSCLVPDGKQLFLRSGKRLYCIGAK